MTFNPSAVHTDEEFRVHFTYKKHQSHPLSDNVCLDYSNALEVWYIYISMASQRFIRSRNYLPLAVPFFFVDFFWALRRRR